MKLKVLVDNNTFIDKYYLGEPAVSYYIENGSDLILFDTGYTDAFIKNANDMGIDLNKVNKLVISHGHDDHTRGLKYFFDRKRDIELISHPLCFDYKEDATGLFIGSPLNKEELASKCHLNLTSTPTFISDNLIFLGEIPVTNSFESRYSIGKTKKEGTLKEDYLNDDSAICYKSEKGLIIITGCSHSGICNIIEYAKKVCNEEKVYAVIGGFHLLEVNERLKSTINYLKENNIPYLYPCHCVSLAAKIEMSRILTINEVGVGLELEF